MEKTSTKLFLIFFLASSAAFLGSTLLANIRIGMLMDFGTIDFLPSLDAGTEREAYSDFARYCIVSMSAYPVMIISAGGFVRSTSMTFKAEGWLLMSMIMLSIFIPVEIYCFWLDWKIIGLHFWGDWPIEEFRNAALARVTALSGLPFIAQLCYYTIPILAIVKPFRLEKRSAGNI